MTAEELTAALRELANVSPESGTVAGLVDEAADRLEQQAIQLAALRPVMDAAVAYERFCTLENWYAVLAAVRALRPEWREGDTKQARPPPPSEDRAAPGDGQEGE